MILQPGIRTGRMPLGSARSLRWTAPLYVGAAIVLSGLAVMIVAARRGDRRPSDTNDRGLAQDRASAG
ncbi:hypothetical protein [Streptomyces sp. NPDC020377]|uniref:hypothetical protein n=1 Tax=Streptomyces sp. NPDC020377 TaxID=3365070 RepID=UPI00378E5F59